MKLRAILAGVGMGLAKHQQERLVQHLPGVWVADLAVGKAAPGQLAGVFTFPQPRDQLQSTLARDPYDAHRPLAGWGGDGRDYVTE